MKGRRAGLGAAVCDQYALRQHHSVGTRGTTPIGIAKSNTAFVRSFAGTRSQSSCVPTRNPLNWAATLPASSPPRRSTISGSVIFGMRRPISTVATSSISRVTRRPEVYARAFVEGRLTEEQLLNFRQETGGNGLSSYPHPWLMPNFWQFPTVSMGLGPLMAIYQARFLKYLHGRGIADTKPRKVWAFLGDGECDEPESLGAISLAGREQLDNLIFVINCNLQRLDGPVRGNGKIVQELEGLFHGAGWNVIKVLWGSGWDRLLAKDKSGHLRKRMEECVDGEYQDFKSKNGAYVRQQFFNKYPETAALVKDMSDDEIWSLRRGGHDPEKVYAAYAAAIKHTGQPTVILAKTVKGYGMGEAGEGQNITHQQKKMGLEALRKFRDRFSIPVSDAKIEEIPFLTLGDKEKKYLEERRRALGGPLPQRRAKSASLDVPELSAFGAQLASTEGREISTTMAFVRILNTLLRDKSDWQVRSADRARRVTYLWHGGNVPAIRNLLPGGSAL